MARLWEAGGGHPCDWGGGRAPAGLELEAVSGWYGEGWVPSGPLRCH